MYIQVLGSAAGGGFPQWNCNCRLCTGVRDGSIKAQARTQSSIAISQDNKNWLLINASPDLLTQIRQFPALQPARKIRDTGICAIVLTDAQIDHVTGLLMLREGCPHDVYCTGQVKQDITHGFPLLKILENWNGGIINHNIPTNGTSFKIRNIEGLEITAYPLMSNAPPYSPHRDKPEPGDNIGLLIEDKKNQKKLFYAPGVGLIEKSLIEAASQADCILIDGTVWVNDEMKICGVSEKLGTDMGHLPQFGKGGIIEFLNSFENKRKILIHVNNTNPILDEDSDERSVLDSNEIEVAYDGMSINL